MYVCMLDRMYVRTYLVTSCHAKIESSTPPTMLPTSATKIAASTVKGATLDTGHFGSAGRAALAGVAVRGRVAHFPVLL
jgi:hypothetical protein